jgi:hypothetical protein
VCAELRHILADMMPPSSFGPDFDAWEKNGITGEAFKSFRGKMDDQLRASMAHMILDALLEGLSPYVKALSSKAVTPEEKQIVKRLKKQVQKFHDEGSHDISRMVYPVSPGRPQEITTAKVRTALMKCGANDGIKGIAFELGCSGKGVERWYKSRGYSSWKEAKEALEQN